MMNSVDGRRGMNFRMKPYESIYASGKHTAEYRNEHPRHHILSFRMLRDIAQLRVIVGHSLLRIASRNPCIALEEGS